MGWYFRRGVKFNKNETLRIYFSLLLVRIFRIRNLNPDGVYNATTNDEWNDQ